MDLYRTSQQHTFSPCPSFAVTPTGNVHVHAVTIHTETAARLGTETPVSLSHTCSPPRPPPRTSSHPFSRQHSCGSAATAAPPGLHRRDHRLTSRHGHSHWPAQRAGSPNAPAAGPQRPPPHLRRLPPAPPGAGSTRRYGGRHPDGHQQQPRVDTGGHRWQRAATGGHPPPPPLAVAPAVKGEGSRSR